MMYTFTKELVGLIERDVASMHPYLCFSIMYIIAWGWSIRPNHTAFTDEFNKSMLWVLIDALILLCHSTMGWTPLKHGPLTELDTRQCLSVSATLDIISQAITFYHLTVGDFLL